MPDDKKDRKFPTKRLSGGPRLPMPEYEWFYAEVERIQTQEKVKNFSLVDLLCRIADEDLDLSMDGLVRYRRLVRLKQKYKTHARTA